MCTHFSFHDLIESYSRMDRRLIPELWKDLFEEYIDQVVESEEFIRIRFRTSEALFVTSARFFFLGREPLSYGFLNYFKKVKCLSLGFAATFFKFDSEDIVFNYNTSKNLFTSPRFQRMLKMAAEYVQEIECVYYHNWVDSFFEDVIVSNRSYIKIIVTNSLFNKILERVIRELDRRSIKIDLHTVDSLLVLLEGCNLNHCRLTRPLIPNVSSE